MHVKACLTARNDQSDQRLDVVSEVYRTGQLSCG